MHPEITQPRKLGSRGSRQEQEYAGIKYRVDPASICCSCHLFLVLVNRASVVSDML
jgi:hypothetical protein